MKHLDLFSGIGGFALAAQQVWGDDYECVGFCDNNKFCQEVLKKRFPGVPIHGDIRTLDIGECDREGGQVLHDERRAYQENQQKGDRRSGGVGENVSVDLLTGGFPCQPFSHAGKRRGKSDDRFLWPEMLRVIKEFKPRWVIAENVRGILSIEGGVVFEQVCLGMEAAGYSVRAFVIPAVAVNAPHRRDRVWICARNTDGNGRIRWEKEINTAEGGEPSLDNAEGRHSDAPDAASEPRPAGQFGMLAGAREGQFGGGAGGRLIADGNGAGLERAVRKGEPRDSGRPAAQDRREQELWNQNWPEVATEFCRMDYGLSVELDGFKLSKAGHRVERLKALGNAIVPQVAVEIMKAIKEVDESA